MMRVGYSRHSKGPLSCQFWALGPQCSLLQIRSVRVLRRAFLGFLGGCFGLGLQWALFGTGVSGLQEKSVFLGFCGITFFFPG